jgi:uncharacterized membrane protein YedE/YeeE
VRRWATHAKMVLFGVVLGATLSDLGFTDFGEIHRMFTFADPRLLLTFAAAVVLAAAGFAIHCRGGKMPARPIRKGTIPGALLFGVGWALTGGCPAALLAQIGEGKLPALLTLAGVLAGTKLGQRLKEKLGWDSGSCAT